jgi:predicted methyltransferase
MRAILSAVLTAALILGGCSSMPDRPGTDLQAAIDNPARSAADRERDLREHPVAVLQLAGFGKGMVIADIFGGGGYYSEILAGVVGPEGRVRLINNQPYHDYTVAESTPRLASARLPNVSYELVPADAMKLGRASLDGAMIIMSYHDLYVVDEAGGWPAIDAAQFLDQIVTALKPGGRLLIVDHAARAGTGKADAQTLHRIEESFAMADLRAHGLEFVASIDALHNVDDDHSKGVMNPEIRGHTDRFVQVYRKPE